MLEAVAVSKSFDGKPVIRGFSQRFASGGHYCLMGPSGCGKTTLLYLLMGLIQPDGGEVRGLRGLKLSAVFQEDRLLTQMSAIANVRLVSPAPIAEVESALCSLGLERESLFAPVETFSGGMKRRVALARALLAQYDALFLDEPYKGLDEATREQVMAVVARRAERKTVVLVTHDPLEAEGYQLLRLGGAAQNSEQQKDSER